MNNFEELVKNHLLFDSHCHLNVSEYDEDRDEVVTRAEDAGLKAVIDIGIDLPSSKKSVQISSKYGIVRSAIGVDPENLIPGSDLFDKVIFDYSDDEFSRWLEKVRFELKELADSEHVFMIGETGMDNYWVQENKNLSVEQRETSLRRQQDLFDIHIGLSKQTGKPLSIHSRNASVRCLEQIQAHEVSNSVFHSLTPDTGFSSEDYYEIVNRILEAGNYIGMNGIVTFKNASLIREVYLKVLKEKRKNINRNNLVESLYEAGFILETDGPYLSPEPFRGKRNEPGYITFILDKLILFL